MAINFDKLPTEKQSNIPEKGFYKFEITRAEMRAPYNGEGPDYLGLGLKLTTLDNKAAGFINDKIVENPKPAVAFKIQRLIRAVDLGISGSMELSDLAKLLVGAKGFVEVTTFTPDNGNEIAIVDLFSHECYYKKNERAVIEGFINNNKPETVEAAVSTIIDNEDDEY